MRSPKYIEVLQRRVIPELYWLFLDGCGMFYQDLAPCHRSKEVKKSFVEHHIKLMEWPGNSPDLNPIENLWSIFKQKVRTMGCTTTKKKLIFALIQVSYKDPKILKDFSKLVNSMLKRIKMLLKNPGGHIMY